MARFHLLFLALAVSMGGVFPAAAQEQPEVDCAKAELQLEMTYCAQLAYQEADDALNEAYRRAMARMRKKDAELKDLPGVVPGAVEALKTAQRAWIGYRDGQCVLAGFPARGGTMEPMLVADCQADLTRKRTQELKATIEAIDP